MRASGRTLLTPATLLLTFVKELGEHFGSQHPALFGFIDSLGSLGLVWFSFREGREAFEKAASLEDRCCRED